MIKKFFLTACFSFPCLVNAQSLFMDQAAQNNPFLQNHIRQSQENMQPVFGGGGYDRNNQIQQRDPMAQFNQPQNSSGANQNLNCVSTINGQTIYTNCNR